MLRMFKITLTNKYWMTSLNTIRHVKNTVLIILLVLSILDISILILIVILSVMLIQIYIEVWDCVIQQCHTNWYMISYSWLQFWNSSMLTRLQNWINSITISTRLQFWNSSKLIICSTWKYLVRLVLIYLAVVTSVLCNIKCRIVIAQLCNHRFEC